MLNINLSGVAFADLPHIANKRYDAAGQMVKGEEAVVVRESGEAWDSDARPAYSVRIGCMHVGYIPLVETVKEEAKKAEEGFLKVWKEGYEDMDKEQLRAVARKLNEGGELVTFRDWKFVGTNNSKRKVQPLLKRCCDIEVIRDSLYVDFNRNFIAPTCSVQAVYYDSVEGRNYEEIGDICSVVASFDLM